MVEPQASSSPDVMELLCQFMVAYHDCEWQSAYFLCKEILRLEPHNQTMLQFKRLLPLKVKQENEEHEMEAEEEEEDDEEARGSDEEEEENSEEGSEENDESASSSRGSSEESSGSSSSEETPPSTAASEAPSLVYTPATAMLPTYPRLRGPRHWRPR